MFCEIILKKKKLIIFVKEYIIDCSINYFIHFFSLSSFSELTLHSAFYFLFLVREAIALVSLFKYRAVLKPSCAEFES